MKSFITVLIALMACYAMNAQEALESWKRFDKDIYGGGFEFDAHGEQKVSRQIPVMKFLYDEKDGYHLRLEVPVQMGIYPQFEKNTVLLFKLADSSVVELPIVNKYGAEHATMRDSHLLGLLSIATKVTRVHYKLADPGQITKSDIVKLRFICDGREHDYRYTGEMRRAFNESLKKSITSAKENYLFNLERIESVREREKELRENPKSGF